MTSTPQNTAGKMRPPRNREDIPQQGQHRGRPRKLAIYEVIFNRISMRIALGVLFLTFILPPEGIMPSTCLFYRITGLPCPGCGVIRSITNISTMNFDAAWAYHPFGFVIYAVLVALSVGNFLGTSRIERLAARFQRWDVAANRAFWVALVAFLSYGVARAGLMALGLWAG